MADTWLPTLITDTPQQGFELAITLSRKGVRYTQPDPEVLHKLRPQLLQAAAVAAGHPLQLRMRPGYDHSYYFIASFIGEHIAHHAAALKAA